MKRFIIFAPNVGVGGGLVLLRALIHAWPPGHPLVAILDQRGREAIGMENASFPIHWVSSSVKGRWRAERLLAATARDDDVIFCFHNLPPILSVRGQVLCYVHTAHLVSPVPILKLKGWIRIRSAIERLIERSFERRIDQYLVQTPTMAEKLRLTLGTANKPIAIMPFVDPSRMPQTVHETGTIAREAPHDRTVHEFDFIYVSDGAPHKNHIRLFAAWELLARQGQFPSLAVTLHPVRDAALHSHVLRLVDDAGVRIVDLGQLPHDRILAMYGNVRALLFASYAESFGIPLIEASTAGLPIIAAELDFVRDVCEPTVTFDPHSSRSIARAVRRFLGQSRQSGDILSPQAFLRELREYAEDGTAGHFEVVARA